MGMPWDLGLNTCGPVNDERLATLVDAGFKYVYLNGTGLNPDALEEGYQAVRRRAGELTPWSIHFPILFSGWDMDEQATAARLFELIELSAPYGVRNATIHLPCYWRLCDGQVGPARAEPHRQMVKRILIAGARQAKEVGIRLNVENCAQHGPQEPAGYCFVTAEDMRAFLADLVEEDLGVCLDTGHAMLGGQIPGEMIRALGGLLHETHMNDNFGPFPGRAPLEADLHRPPGIGKIDWLDVMDALDEIAYPYPIVFEEGMAQVGGDTFEFMARATYENWRAFERARAKRDGMDPAALPR